MVRYKNDEMHLEKKIDLRRKLEQYKCKTVEELRDLLAKYNLALVLDYEKNN